jgi:hypothetical protein
MESFSRFIGKRPVIDGEFIKDFSARFEERFKDTFQKRMRSDSFLVKEMLSFRLERFLHNEMRRDVAEVVCLEKTFAGKIEFGQGSFRFKAVVDRIDRLSDASLLIIDYKTGNTDILPADDPRAIERACRERGLLKEAVKSFQLPLYVYFVGRDPRFSDAGIDAALYSVKDFSQDYGLNRIFRKKDSPNERAELMEAYMNAAGALLQDILDPGVPFYADENDIRQCANCPFFYLCR